VTPPGTDSPPTPRLLTGVPTAIALLTMALGIVDIVSALTPERVSRLRNLTEVVPLEWAHVASAGTAVAGLLLVMLGHGLRRRKRRAWRGAVVLLLLSAGLNVVKGLDAEEAIVAFVLAVALIVLNRQFYAAGDPTTRLRAPATFVAMALSSVVLGLGLVYARDGSVAGHPSFLDRLDHVLLGLVGVTGPLQFRSERAEIWERPELRVPYDQGVWYGFAV